MNISDQIYQDVCPFQNKPPLTLIPKAFEVLVVYALGVWPRLHDVTFLPGGEYHWGPV